VTARSRLVIAQWLNVDNQSGLLLEVRVADAKAQDDFYQSLISEVKIFKVTALLSMEKIKYSTELALP
jgi:Lrp/AsnC family transcriptional regulator